jgi:uncharacterized delta-60 repeat protein
MKRISSKLALKRMQIILALTLTLTSASFFLPRIVQAVDGDLDPTFGTGDASVPAGVSRTSFGATPETSSDAVAALGFQSTGKIIAGGNTAASGSDFALVRYNTNGTLDTSFGSGMTGKTTTDIRANDSLTDLAIEPVTDKIVAVGATTGLGSCFSADVDWAIAKYNADGSPDTGFNGTGTLVIDFFGCNDAPLGVVIQPDNKIVVVGFGVQAMGMSSTFFLILVRLNSDGTFDSTFNGDGDSDGKIMFDQTTTGLGQPSDIVRIPSGTHMGKFIVVGQASPGGEPSFMVARFNSDGSLDTTFGPADTGFVATDFTPSSFDIANSVALQSDGKILAGGTANGADFALARYDSDGGLDTMFNSTGKVVTDFSDMSVMRTDTGKFVGVMSDGKIIMSGQSQGGDFTNNLGIARYNTDGTLDTAFGSAMNGKVVTHLGQNGMTDNAVIPNAGALQSDDKILVGGQINTSMMSDVDMFVARFQNAPAVVPCTLTCPGPITTSNDPGQCSAVVTFAPTSSGSCGMVICNPASGSPFPVGTTTVTCTPDTGTPCSFTVTVNDTEPPSFTSCPASIGAVSSQGCSSTPSSVVNFSAPPTTDNCSGVMVSCVPPSGSSFSTGTTTVTCTATDASSNTATCSFGVTVFAACLQDDSNAGNAVLFNPATGEYRFCCGGVLIASGVGTVTKVGCTVTIQHNIADRRVLIKADTSSQKGTASLQKPPGTTKCSITDTNKSSGACMCQ